ncbi:MAG: DUF4102 domain-containing protein [Deltaproteobacteria bacterium]|nr:DUF4102 domain-containing protein [Deltaproteobacteria bacterium]
MAQIKLTKPKIDALTPKQSRYYLWDSDVQGLCIRVAPNGRKTFDVFYRTHDGTQRFYHIGPYGAVTLVQAREEARSILA